MKAWILEGRFGLDALKIVEREAPQPRRGEVLVRVRAASLNYRDLVLVEGTYNPALRLPLIPVSDGAGEVTAIGEGVTRVKIGDRVMGAFIPRWLGGRPPQHVFDARAASSSDGVLAEYAVFDEDGAVPIPEHLTFEEASTLPIAALTAWHALFVDAPGRAGDTVLVQGTGGVAVFAIQLARAAGARVIVTSSSDAKLVRAKEIGAHEGINYRTTPAWDERVQTLTCGIGADLVLDVGGGTLARSVNAVRLGGQVSVVGFLAGATAQIDVLPLLVRNVRIQGINVGNREWFDDLNRALGQHGIHPVIDRAFAFEQAREAFETMRGGAFVGKLVIRGV